MCYPKPGPRCSNHARAAALKARGEYVSAVRALGKDSYPTDKVLELKEKYENAKRAWFTTPQGMKNLERKIEHTWRDSEKADLITQLEEAQAQREQQIAAYHATTTTPPDVDYEQHDLGAVHSPLQQEHIKKGTIFMNKSGKMLEITAVRGGKAYFRSIDENGRLMDSSSFRSGSKNITDLANSGHQLISTPESTPRKTKPSSPKFTPKEAEKLYMDAMRDAIAAGEAHRPTPMVVAQHENPLDDNSPITEAWKINEGACGFAWVDVHPGNSSFARWAVKEGFARKAYGGGVSIHINQFGQSYERKTKAAGVLAQKLKEAGIRAYAQGRLD